MDAHVQGNLLRFVTIHLETDADPVTQLKQANELVQALNSEDNPPVVLCGDFNADADTPNPTVATRFALSASVPRWTGCFTYVCWGLIVAFVFLLPLQG